MSSPENKKLNKVVAIAVILVILIIGGAGAGYYFRGDIKKVLAVRNSKSLVQEANELIEKGEWQLAYDKAFAAHRLDPSSLDALKAFFKTAGRTSSPHLLRIAAAITVHPESTRDDKVEALTLVQLAGDDLRFMMLYNSLSEELRKEEDISFLKARFMARVGASENAQTLVNEYLQSGGKDLRFRLLQIGLLLNPGLPEEERKRGQELLVALLKEGNADSKQGLGLLWQYPVGLINAELFPTDSTALLEAIPGIETRDRLAMAKVDLVRVKESAEQVESLIRKQITDYAATDPESLAVWLAGLRRFDLILEVLDESRGRESLVTFDLRLQALAATQGAEAAEKWLETPHDNSSPLLVHLSRAKLAFAQNKRNDGLNEMKSAFFEADLKKDRASYLQIYQTAMQLRQMDDATRALVMAAQREGRSFPTIQQISPNVMALYQQGDFRSMAQVFEAVAPTQPGNMTVLNNLAYSKLILGEESEAPVNAGRKLVEENPEVLGLRTTLAFGLMQQEEWDEAYQVLNEEGISWDQASPADLAIHALSLEQQGKTPEAQAVRSRFKVTQLTIPERDAFAAIRRSYTDETKAATSLKSLITQAKALPVSDQAGVTNLLSEAVFLAEIRNDRESFLQIYEVAMATGLVDFASGVLFEASRRPGDSFPSSESIVSNLDFFLKAGDLGGLGQVLEVALQSEPANLSLANRLNLTRVLQGESGLDAARELVEKNPNAVGPAATLALGLMKEGKWEESVGVLGRSGIQWDQATPFDWAIFGLALEKGGDTESLATVQGKFDSDQLSKAERDILALVRGTFAGPASRADSLESALDMAREAAEGGDRIQMSRLLGESFSYAELANSRSAFLGIYRAAQDLGQIDFASRALAEAARRPGQEFPGSNEVTPVLAFFVKEDNFRGIRQVLLAVSELEPSNVTVADQLAYARLILGEASEGPIQVVRELAEPNPSSLSPRTTLALGLMLQNQWEEGLKVLETAGLDWNAGTASDLIIHSLALAGAGRNEEAKQVRSRADLGQLARTELAVFSRLEAAAASIGQ